MNFQSSDIPERLGEIQRQDKILKEQINQQIVLVEKLVNGKVNKQLYLDSETAINKRKEEAVSKILAVINTL